MTTPEILLPGEKRNLAFEVSSDELRSLEYFRARYFALPGNAADALNLVVLAALSAPATIIKIVESQRRYSAAEGVPVLQAFHGQIRRHKQYRRCAPLLTTP
jgi:hypothetical protein